MKMKFFEIIFWIVTSLFLLGFFIFFGLVIFYKDNNAPNPLDFSNHEITEKIITSNKQNIIQEIEVFTKTYVDTAYLQWVRINTYVAHGNISNERIECTYNTYEKKSKQYGEIHTLVNTITGTIKSIRGTYGYDKKDIPLNTSNSLTKKLENLTFYLDTASKKMSEANQDTLDYDYELIFEDDQILIYNQEDQYIYNDQIKEFEINELY